MVGKATQKTVARQIAGLCGPCDLLLVGNVEPSLVSGLRLHGLRVSVCPESTQAEGVDGEPASTVAHASTAMGGILPRQRFDAVVAFVEDDRDMSLVGRFVESAKALCCVVDCRGSAVDGAREAWEQTFIRFGWRKHPLTELVAPYGSLDEVVSKIWTVFEPIPKEALAAYPLEALKAERDLHMDMTREAGRRSDAHIARYSLASQFIREGDAVLDSACGLGYGSHLLSAATRASSVLGVDESGYAVRYAGLNFRASGSTGLAFSGGDAENLSFIEDKSRDFVVSVETLEHLHHPQKFLSEAFRILTPGGRVFVSVPNDWSDETGEDPNPHHHHVYHWDVLRDQLIAAGFILERAWLQDAGGGMRCHDAKRSIREFPVESGPDSDGEWLLALAIKPLSGKDEEGAAGNSDDTPNILAFARDYQDPWLVRALVAQGWRATSKAALLAIARDVLRRSGVESSDRGAALCVLAYAALEGALTDGERSALISDIESYLRGRESSVTVFRWYVSLRYVYSQLLLAAGDLDRAIHQLQVVSEADVLRFSPLLATKSLSAALQLGMVELSGGKPAQAAHWWGHVLSEAKRTVSEIDWREVIGDPDSLQTFGFPELASIFLTAAKAANGLRLLQDGQLKPSLVWRFMHSTLPDRLETLELELALQAGQEAPASAKYWLATQVVSWQAESQQKELAIQELRKEVASLAAGRDWLHQQKEAWRLESEHKGRVIQKLQEELAALASGREWLNEQSDAWRSESERKDRVIDELRAQLSSMVEGRDWLTSQVGGWGQECEERGRAIETLRGELEASEAARRWLDAQLRGWMDEAEKRNQAFAEARGEIQGLEAGRAWMQGQVQSWTAAFKGQEDVITALREEVASLQSARDWLVEQVEGWKAEAERWADASRLCDERGSESAGSGNE